MDQTVDYFYNGDLRWTFGFDNPNKAAVIFAGLLPILCGVLSATWQMSAERRGLKIALLVGTFVFVVGDSFCLFHTYSRGGAVAAAMGVLYLLVQGGVRTPLRIAIIIRSPQFLCTVVLVAIIGSLFLWTGLSERSLEPITKGDDSVRHRIALWESGLQMAVEKPAGFGPGNSGEAYMQWYQPIDSRDGYRTMVNSYLTFLVEQGWLWSAALLLVAAYLWISSSPAPAISIRFTNAIALRASLLAFAASGIFSTVMEEPLLWIIPSLCIIALIPLTIIGKKQRRSSIVPAFATVMVVLAILYAIGFVKSSTDPISRRFTTGVNSDLVATISRKPSGSRQQLWTVIPDEEVLGHYYGKLLRKIALEADVAVQVGTPAENHQVDRLLLVGKSARETPVPSATSTILLFPSEVPATQARAWLSSAPDVKVLIPSIDEDQRGAFWQDCLANFPEKKNALVTLSGVGLRVDWAWQQVVDAVKKS